MSSIPTATTVVADASSSSKNQDWKKDYNEFGKSSLDILVEWMLDGSYPGENYEKYVGKSKPGEAKTKAAYCEEINDLLVKTGHVSRQTKGIMEQIRQIKNSFHDWHTKLASTIYRVDPSNEDAHDIALKESVIRKFKYYYILIPLFVKEPSVSLAGVSSSEDPVEENSDDEDLVFPASGYTVSGVCVPSAPSVADPLVGSPSSVSASSPAGFNKKQLKKSTEKARKRDFSEAIFDFLEAMTKSKNDRSQRKAAKFEAKKERQEMKFKERKMDKRIQLLTLYSQPGNDEYVRKQIKDLLKELEG